MSDPPIFPAELPADTRRPGSSPPDAARTPARAREQAPELGRLGRAVADTLRSIPLRPEHAAIAELARELARLMDASSSVVTYAKLSPRLAGVLRELGATPATGRRSSNGGDDDGDDPADDELAELERNVDTRADRAAGVDAAAS